MRLPQPSSSQGVAFAPQNLNRDFLAIAQVPASHFNGPLLNALQRSASSLQDAGFDSILSRTDGGQQSSAPDRQSRPIESRSATSPNEDEQAISDIDRSESSDDEVELVAAEDNVLVAAIDVPIAEPTAADGEHLFAKSDEQTDTDITTLDPGQASITSANAAGSEATPQSAASQVDSPERQRDRLVSLDERANVVKEVRDQESPGSIAVSSTDDERLVDQGDSLVSTPDDRYAPSGEPLMTDQGLDIGPGVATDGFRRSESTAPTMAESTGQGEERSRRAARGNRPRLAGNANQRNTGEDNRSNGPQSTGTPKTGTLLASEQTADATLGTTTTDSTGQATTATPANPDAAVSADLAGPLTPAGLGNKPESVNRQLTNGAPSNDSLVASAQTNDSAGQNGDRSTGSGTQSLSRTDIADRARLIHRISKAFVKLGVDGGQVRMKMHPETLGGVLLEMQVRGKQVEATVTAESESARDLLQEQLPELRQRLESQGLKVQRLEVQLRDDTTTGASFSQDPRGGMFGGDGGSGGSDRSHHRGWPSNAGKRSLSGSTNDASAAKAAHSPAAALTPAAPGKLDLRL
jgi:flagellar hook-length control protein FliK